MDHSLLSAERPSFLQTRIPNALENKSIDHRNLENYRPHKCVLRNTLAEFLLAGNPRLHQEKLQKNTVANLIALEIAAVLLVEGIRRKP
jgi:hypothetical protein